MAAVTERSLAIGVAYVGFSDPGDGVPGTDYKQYSVIEEGSVVLNFNDPTSVDFRAEGMRDPWESFDKAGDADSMDFNIPSPTAAECEAFMGGEVDSDGKWNAPIEIPVIRKSFLMKSLSYKGRHTEYEFALCKVSGKLTQAPSSEQTDLLQIRVTKLTPIKSDGTLMSPWSRAVVEES
jgi:hypothetical protein